MPKIKYLTYWEYCHFDTFTYGECKGYMRKILGENVYYANVYNISKLRSDLWKFSTRHNLFNTPPKLLREALDFMDDYLISIGYKLLTDKNQEEKLKALI